MITLTTGQMNKVAALSGQIDSLRGAIYCLNEGDDCFMSVGGLSHYINGSARLTAKAILEQMLFEKEEELERIGVKIEPAKREPK